MRKLEAGFRENELSYMLVLRLVPLFPFWLVNLAPAFLGVRTSTFIIGTFVGIIPGALVFASVGTGLGAILASGGTPDGSALLQPHVLLPIGGLVILALIPVVLSGSATGRPPTWSIPHDRVHHQCGHLRHRRRLRRAVGCRRRGPAGRRDRADRDASAWAATA